MDFMDIDQVVEVPDTPERFIAACNNEGNSPGNYSDGSSSCRVISKDHINENPRNESREKGKSVTIRGNRRLFVRPDNCTNSSNLTLGNSSSSKNQLPSLDNSHLEKGKALSNPKVQRSNSQENSSFVDLTEQSGRGHVFGKATSTRVSGSGSAHPFRKCMFPANGYTEQNGHGKGVVVGVQHKPETNSSLSMSPNATRQKRLVRNGCISPHNIAKSKQITENHETGRVTKDLRVDIGGPSSTVNIKDLITEAKNSRRFKGKGVSHHPLSEEPNARNRHLSRRTSLISKEASNASKDLSVDTSTCFKESDSDPHVSRGKAASSSCSQRNTIYNHFEDLEIDSTQRAQLTKRQREGVSLNTIEERDVPRVDDYEIPYSGEHSISRSARNKNPRSAGTSDPVIALDEGSSVRALQVEADEILARELQEQLYNEETDSHHALAMAMQQEHTSHAGGRSTYRPASRGSNLYQQSRSNSSRNPPPVSTQASTSTRLVRLRGRFPGRPRTLSSATTRGNSIFPPNMDVDMRMQILEALEAFNDMDLPNDLQQIGREFNENDYEMLLALDDNNHHHGGATHAQINNLPHSTVQAENLEECAICLETPSIGETIRHLPCLHRFHKDCIDRWLRRKTSCPVCKSSVT